MFSSLHVVMRKFCFDEPPGTTMDADLLLYSLAVAPDPVEVKEEGTMQPIYTKKWYAINVKLKKNLPLMSQNDTTLFFVPPCSSLLHPLLWEPFT